MTPITPVRPATPADAHALSVCHLACWREAYAGIVPAATLAALTCDLDAMIQRWRGILGNDPRRTWLAATGSEVLGFSSVGPARDEDLDQRSELYALYIRASEYGGGLADSLMHSAIGAEPAYLWVAKGNARALRYYRRVGFRPDGHARVDDRFGGITETRMVRG